MRKLIYSINLTLDGCADHTKGIANAELHSYYTQLLDTADTFLYGRKTYELMVPYWPDVAKNPTGHDKAIVDFAKAYVAVKNIVVFSRTLQPAAAKNVRITSGNLRDEVMKLKNEDGKAILAGGVDIPSQLIDLDLVDEYLIVVQPLLVGDGTRLLQGYNLQRKLNLVDCKTLASGFVALRYTR